MTDAPDDPVAEPAEVPSDDAHEAQLGRQLPAGRVLPVRLLEQLAVLRAADLSIRSGDEEGVHDARLGSRRLQAALAMFRPAVDVRSTEPLRDELKWLARSLGAARDRHVAQQRLSALATREGEAAGILLGELHPSDPTPGDGGHNEAVLAVLDSTRYAALLAGLETFAAEPDWTPRADDDAGPFVRRRVRKEWERLAQRVSLVIDHPSGQMPHEALHDVRKAAKRLRYGLEVAELLWRRKPKRLGHLVHQLTDVLGERQDIAITRAFLLQLATRAQSAGEPTFVHGRLDRVEEMRSVELEGQFVRVWSATVARRQRWP
jgi:CHAD domain-containing protein